jgi:hypothetical protein
MRDVAMFTWTLPQRSLMATVFCCKCLCLLLKIVGNFFSINLVKNNIVNHFFVARNAWFLLK